jgi:hypothetical protein
MFAEKDALEPANFGQQKPHGTFVMPPINQRLLQIKKKTCQKRPLCTV